jgi:hypothetical protein
MAIRPASIVYATGGADSTKPPSRGFWHERSHRDEAHQWLRSVVFEMFNDKGTSLGN